MPLEPSPRDLHFLEVWKWMVAQPCDRDAVTFLKARGGSPGVSGTEVVSGT